MKTYFDRNSNLIWSATLLVALAITLASCSKKTDARDISGNTRGVNNQRTFQAQGIIKRISFADREIVIQHGEITNYMAAMTMPFPVRDTNELNGLKIGDAISFRVVALPDDEWVEQLKPMTASVAPQTNRIDFIPFVENLKPGDSMPSYEFINSVGAKTRLSDFNGQALAVGFYFQTTNQSEVIHQPEVVSDFSIVQQLLMQNKTMSQNWKLLCVSLNPKSDPRIFLNLGRSLNFTHWQFLGSDAATLSKFADECGVVVWPGTNAVSYNSRIIVVNADGKIQTIFKGKNWTGTNVADAMIKAITIP